MRFARVPAVLLVLMCAFSAARAQVNIKRKTNNSCGVGNGNGAMLSQIAQMGEENCKSTTFSAASGDSLSFFQMW